MCASVAEILCESAIARLAVSLWGWSSLQVIVCELRGGGGEGRKGRTDRRKGRAERGSECVSAYLGERWEGEKGERGEGGREGQMEQLEKLRIIFTSNQPTTHTRTHAHTHTHTCTHPQHTSTV